MQKKQLFAVLAAAGVFAPYAIKAQASDEALVLKEEAGTQMIQELSDHPVLENEVTEEGTGQEAGIALASLDESVKEGTIQGISYQLTEDKTLYLSCPVNITADFVEEADEEGLWAEAKKVVIQAAAENIDIENGAFSGNSSLADVQIKGIASLGEYSFEFCENLTTVTILDGTVSIAQECFNGCESLSTVILPESLEELGAYCFQDCSALSAIRIPEGIRLLDCQTFAGCSSLKEIILPESLEEIGESCFDGCESLTEVILPESIEYLGMASFGNCTSLESFIIPDSVTEVGEYIFTNCSSLKTVTYGENVASISTNHFSSDSDVQMSLEQIIVLGQNTKIVIDKRDTTTADFSAVIIQAKKDSAAAAFAAEKNFGILQIIFENIFSGWTVLEGHTYYYLEDGTPAAGWQNIESADYYFNEAGQLQTGLKEIDGKLYYLDPEKGGAKTVSQIKDIDGTEYLFDAQGFGTTDWKADYSKLNALIDEISKKDFSNYTDDSVQSVNSRIKEIENSIDYSLSKENQSAVDGYKAALETALANLQLKAADYSAVEQLKKQFNNLDKTLYTDASVQAVNDYIVSIQTGLTILDQNRVDDYAAGLKNKIDQLTLKQTDNNPSTDNGPSADNSQPAEDDKTSSSSSSSITAIAKKVVSTVKKVIKSIKSLFSRK